MPRDIHLTGFTVCIYFVCALPWLLVGVRNRQHSVVRMTSDLCLHLLPSHIKTPPEKTTKKKETCHNEKEGLAQSTLILKKNDPEYPGLSSGHDQS